MDAPLLEASRALIGEGVLGIVALGLSWVCYRLYNDKTELEKELRQRWADQMVSNVRVIGELAKSVEDRNKVLDGVAAGMSEMAAGFKALAQLLESQHDRLLDRMQDVRERQERH